MNCSFLPSKALKKKKPNPHHTSQLDHTRSAKLGLIKKEGNGGKNKLEKIQ